MNIKKLNYITVLFSAIITLFLILYFVIDANKTKSKLFFSHNDQLSILQTLDSDFNNFIVKEYEFNQFDILNSKLHTFLMIINTLILESKTTNLSPIYIAQLENIKKEFLIKELWIERLKSRKAFEFNIITFILDSNDAEFQTLHPNLQHKINQIKLNVVRDIYLKDLDIEILIQNYNLKEIKNPYFVNLISQIKALESSVKFQKLNHTNALNEKLAHTLGKAKNELYIDKEATQDIYWLIFNFLFVSIATFIGVLIFFYNKLSNTKKQLSAFKTAVENSDNVIVLTDLSKKIIFANDAFSKITGYSTKEAIGKNPSILKSGLQSDTFYKELNETITQGQTWRGRFINKNNKGDIFYENASISPIFEDGYIAGYLAIKLDITESILHAQELEKLNLELENRVNQELEKARTKDKLLIQQSKMASMGEMIGNIAHQWRQPLSAISTSASGVSLYNQLGMLRSEDIENYMNQIIKNSEYLSNTIENFRNFFNPNKPKESKTMALIFEEIGHIVNSTLVKHNVETIIHIEDMTLHTHINELKQVLLNLIKNGSDAIKNGGFIVIDSYLDSEFIHIKVKDTGGGIPEEIIEKIYEPYFTTKHQSIGTGLGLNMTYQIVTEQFRGTISASNETFMIADDEYTGALFHIQLPLTLLVQE